MVDMNNNVILSFCYQFNMKEILSINFNTRVDIFERVCVFNWKVKTAQ